MNAALRHATNHRDATLVQHHRAGDPTAFADLYQTYHPQLLRFIRRRVREGHIAEDLTHDTFARALDRLGELRNPERFYPWLTVIARRLVINHYRDIGHVNAIADLDPGQSEAPDHQMLRRVEQDNVREALDRVRDNYREVLRLREGEELSYNDIAQRLGITEALVTIWLHRARRALRREYLAVTEPERTAALAPVLYGAAASLRRLRDRITQLAVHIPDGATASGPMLAAAGAGIAIGLATLLGPNGALPAHSGVDVPTSPLGTTSSDPHGSGSGPRYANSARPGSTDRPVPHTSPTVVRSDVGEVGVGDDAGVQETRDRVRDWPIVFDQGPVGFGINPEPLWEDLAAITPTGSGS